jgi:hypothetical protein
MHAINVEEKVCMFHRPIRHTPDDLHCKECFRSYGCNFLTNMNVCRLHIALYNCINLC